MRKVKYGSIAPTGRGCKGELSCFTALLKPDYDDDDKDHHE